MSVIVDGTAGLTFNDASTQNTAATGFGFKNRIINGDMRIDQRNAGASVSTNGAYTVDRWKMFLNGGGVFSAQRSTIVPNNSFTNSVVLTVTTPDASIGAFDFYAYNQDIEGFNAADFGWGTPDATSVTLSFWVRSSITGTWVAALCNADGSRAYPATFTIALANTWQYVTLTVPGITSGTWNTTNGSGVTLRFDLGSGSSNNGTANTWNTAGGFAGVRTSSSVNWIATNGATLYVTGVSLEKGSTATSFDYRPYGTELALCQRYALGLRANQGLGSGVWYTSSAALHQMQFPVEMRSAPTLTTNTGVGRFYLSGSSVNSTGGNITINAASSTACEFFTTVSGGTGGQGTSVTVVSGVCVLSSEL